jgi:hypothetical protein
MGLLGLTDFLIFGAVLVLTIFALAIPKSRYLRISAIFSLAAVATGYTLMRPGVRAALNYHQHMGGTWSKEWLAGVESLLAVTQHFSTIVLVAALLLAVIALRSK